MPAGASARKRRWVRILIFGSGLSVMRVRLYFVPMRFRRSPSIRKGIPRLMNIICDNALLNAYARSQGTVSADIIKEVARDLRLRPEVQTHEAETTPSVIVSNAEPETFLSKAANDVPQRTSEAHSKSWS